MRIGEGLAKRQPCEPAHFERCIEALDARYRGAFRAPSGDLTLVTPGAYFLASLDEHGRPTYARKPRPGEEEMAGMRACCGR